MASPMRGPRLSLSRLGGKQKDVSVTVEVRGPIAELLRAIANFPGHGIYSRTNPFDMTLWVMANEILEPPAIESPYSIATKITLPKSSSWPTDLGADPIALMAATNVEDALDKAFCYALNKHGVRTRLNISLTGGSMELVYGHSFHSGAIQLSLIGDEKQVNIVAERFLFELGGPGARGLIFDPPMVVQTKEYSQTRIRTENKDGEAADSVHVFISYKTADQWFAQKVFEYLKRREFPIQVSIDLEEIFAGDSLPEQLGKLLQSYDVALIVMSPAYFSEGGWAKEEAETIIQNRISKGKRFVPILLSGNSSQIPSIFAKYRFVDFRKYCADRSPEEFRSRIVEVVEGILHRRVARS